MKKTLIIVLVILAGFSAEAQTKYEKGMEKAFALWQQNKTTEAANLFERISTAAPEKWIPAYYAAQVNILSAFAIKDKSLLTQQLEKAQKQLDRAEAISPKNPEIMVMQAMLYTVWVAYDGSTYGMKYAPKVSEIYAKAYAIAKDNPRVVLCKTEWEIGSARYFGKETAPFCKELKRAETLFSTEKKQKDFMPSWGKDRVTELLKDCKA